MTRRHITGTTPRSHDPMQRPNRNARPRTTNLDVFIDAQSVTALIDTGDDYSVVSGPLATKLRNVNCTWEYPQIRTAGGHLLKLTGTCTVRITVYVRTYPATFVIPQQC